MDVDVTDRDPALLVGHPAPVHLRMFSLLAFGWMLVAACLTMTVHVVQLVMVRRVEPESLPGVARGAEPGVLGRTDARAGPCGPPRRSWRWASWLTSS
jgi:hypothetical protein